MSNKNTLENKKLRREERAVRKARSARLFTLAITPEEQTAVEEEPRVSELVIAEHQLWTPGKEEQ